MNTQMNGMPESYGDPRISDPQAISPAQRLYWSVRRELWETRSIYLAPLAAAVVFLLGFLFSTIRLPAKIRSLSALAPDQQRQAIALPYDMAAGLIMVTALFVGVFYCLDALYGERRDRSILFWKSLPVSDLTTVISKASIPLVILPLLTVAISVAMQFIMLLLSSAVLIGNGLSVGAYWTQLSFIQMSFLLFYHLVTVHALWHAPIYGWLLLVSAWARRAAFLWAALPPLTIYAVEKVVFNTSHFAAMLDYRLSGGGMEAITGPDSFPMDPMTYLTPGKFLTSPGLWLGLAAFAVFLAAAARLRRYRGPI